MLYVQEQSPFPRHQVGVGRQMSPYQIVDEEGLLPEEYESIVPGAMIPVAFEAEVEEPLAVEEGEDVIWLHVQQIDDDEEEENQAEVMEDCDWIHNVEDDDDDDAYYEYTGTEEYDHTYECFHEETREAVVQVNADNENENQEMEDDRNLN